MERKSLIYKTGVEYGDYTLNHVNGCSHGCKYPCYAFMLAKRFGKVKTYDEWLKPEIAENALEILDKELPRFKDKIKTLHLCFTTDPFMYGYNDVEKMSLEILKKANSYGIKCSVLTKGVLPLSLSKLPLKNEYGITLVSLDNAFQEEYEPGASPIEFRINSLKRLHDEGCYTWVSIEPYPTPNIYEQELLPILEKISFVDKIIFGKINYNPLATKYKDRKRFFNECANMVIEFCENNSINYHIKNGTLTEKEEND